jgi:hypothetical protein
VSGSTVQTPIPDRLRGIRAPASLPIPDFQRDLDIRLAQGSKIPSKSTQVYLFYSDAVANTYEISRTILEMQYDYR